MHGRPPSNRIPRRPDRATRAHHPEPSGRVEWGAAAMAATPEAVFVSMVDNSTRNGQVQLSPPKRERRRRIFRNDYGTKTSFLLTLKARDSQLSSINSSEHSPTKFLGDSRSQGNARGPTPKQWPSTWEGCPPCALQEQVNQNCPMIKESDSIKASLKRLPAWQLHRLN